VKNKVCLITGANSGIGKAAAVALAWQGLITYVAFVDSGVLTRQLGMLSPIRPDQFASRAMLDWIEANVTSSSTVLFTPHVREQPYLSLYRGDLQRSGRIVSQGYFDTRDRVHSRASLTSELVQKLKSTRYVATSMSLRELGLRDALVRELVQPAQDSDAQPQLILFYSCLCRRAAAQRESQLQEIFLWLVRSP